ncbi:MAG: DMT family transporter [Gemmobacter sp.]|jgi:drug/metabolite transporter (DMT)-like permease
MQTYRPLAAAVWMVGSILSFTAMAIAGRSVADVHDTFEVMLWRSVTGFALVVLVAGLTGQLGAVQTRNLPQHVMRNVVHFTGQNLWFWALTAIPLAQVFALEFTSPIWVILLSPLFLGERLTRFKLLAAAMGFAGALIVAQPDFRALDPGMLAAAGSAICFACTAILTKRLTRGESIVSILFWLTLMQAVFGLLAASLDGAVALPTAKTLPWLALIGAAGVIAHLCLTKALALAPASIVVPIDFARLPLIAFVGASLYGEPISLAVLAGGTLVFLANWLNIRSDAWQRGRSA